METIYILAIILLAKSIDLFVHLLEPFMYFYLTLFHSSANNEF